MHNIVIIGGNISGIGVAHYLLRNVIPPLKSETQQYKVTLISPSDHTYYKITAPRAIVSEDIVNHEKLFGSIPNGFKQYENSEFTFLKGEATRVDPAGKVVSTKLSGSSKVLSVKYDSLVIATGTTSKSPLWTLHGDYKITSTALKRLNESLVKAESVLIAGGGAAGVETAGEIASYLKLKDITILSGSTRFLPRLNNTSVSKAAESHLAALNVNTVHNVRVTSSTENANGTTTLNLSDGSIKTVDIYIDATGGVPNTGFLPADWLDENKRVATNGTTLRATKAPAGVYSIGDAASYSKQNVLDAVYAVAPLGYTIWYDLHAISNIVDTSLSSKKPVVAILKEKKYKQIESDMQVVPIGPKGGVGALFGVKLPSFVVWLLKSRTFLLENAPKVATG